MTFWNSWFQKQPKKDRIANLHIKNEGKKKKRTRKHHDLEQKPKQTKTKKIQEAAKSLNLIHSIFLKTGRLVG